MNKPTSMIAFFLFLFSSTLLAYQAPTHIKILKESGVAVRRATQTAADILAIAYPGYTYPVTDSRVAYYEIILPDGQTGWIYANEELKWTEQLADSRVMIRFQGGGINVRKDPYDLEETPVGIALSNSEYPISDIYYSHYKVKLPDGNIGWLYGGKMSDGWVVGIDPKEVGTTTKKDGFYVDFSNLMPSGTLDVYTVKCTYNGEMGEGYMRFNIPGESYLTAEFDLATEPKTESISMTHKSSYLQDASLEGRSPMSLSLNGYTVIENYDPGSHHFVTDQWSIAKFLKKGKNRIKIEYKNGSSPYGLKSFRIE